jgi:hypothetical protein
MAKLVVTFRNFAKARKIIQVLICFFDAFLTVQHSIDFSKYQLNAQFFYSSTIFFNNAKENCPNHAGL